MAEQDAHTQVRRNEHVIARQMAESERILRTRRQPHHVVSPVYGIGEMTLVEFLVAAIMGLVVPSLGFILLRNAQAILPIVIWVYSILMLIIACACYFNLERSHFQSWEVTALFTFAIVTAIEAWVPLGGVVSGAAAYFLLMHNGWLQ